MNARPKPRKGWADFETRLTAPQCRQALDPWANAKPLPRGAEREDFDNNPPKYTVKWLSPEVFEVACEKWYESRRSGYRDDHVCEGIIEATPPTTKVVMYQVLRGSFWLLVLLLSAVMLPIAVVVGMETNSLTGFALALSPIALSGLAMFFNANREARNLEAYYFARYVLGADREVVVRYKA